MNLYRIEIITHWDFKESEWGIPKFILKLFTFPVHKETPCGYWFYDNLGKERWVGKNSRISYAYTKIQDARRNFIKRTKKREMLLSNQLDKTRKGLELIDNFYKSKKDKTEIPF